VRRWRSPGRLDDQLLLPTPSPNIETQQWLESQKVFFGAQDPADLSKERRQEHQQLQSDTCAADGLISSNSVPVQ